MIRLGGGEGKLAGLSELLFKFQNGLRRQHFIDLLGCKIGVLNRLPASYFVSVSYMCWAYRRHGVTLKADGAISTWLY